jgi:hypothetical protein
MTGFGTDAFIEASLCYIWHIVNEAPGAQAICRPPEEPDDGNDSRRVLAADSPETLMELRPSPVTQASSSQSTIDLFRSLFRGREDVYPRRFESRKTGKSGYAPACENKWVASRVDGELARLRLEQDLVTLREERGLSQRQASLDLRGEAGTAYPLQFAERAVDDASAGRLVLTVPPGTPVLLHPLGDRG